MLTRLPIGLKFALAFVLPLLVIVVLAGYVVIQKALTHAEAGTLTEVAPLTSDISALVHELQRERGASAVFLGSRGGRFGAEMKGQRGQTDRAREAFEATVARMDLGALGPSFPPLVETARRKVADLVALRPSIAALGMDAKQSNAAFTGTIRSLLDVVRTIAVLASDPDVAGMTRAYEKLMEGKERAGQERAVGAGAFAAGAFDPETYRRFVSLIAEQDAFLTDFLANATDDQRAHFAKAMDSDATRKVQHLRKLAFDSIATGTIEGATGPEWFNAATARIDLLNTVEHRMAADLEATTAAVDADATLVLLSTIASVMAAAAVAAGTAWLIVRELTRALGGLALAMDRLSRKDLSVAVLGTDRRDEIGKMAAAVQVFKDALLRQAELEESQKAQAEARRQRAERIESLTAAFDKKASEVVTQFAASASNLHRHGHCGRGDQPPRRRDRSRGRTGDGQRPDGRHRGGRTGGVHQ